MQRFISPGGTEGEALPRQSRSRSRQKDKVSQDDKVRVSWCESWVIKFRGSRRGVEISPRKWPKICTPEV